MELIFGTGNSHKIQEIQSMLPEGISLFSLKDIAYHEELPETSDTIEGNAIEKATHLYRAIGKPCFSEDTGLVVPALNGAPGIYSARYAGKHGDDVANYTLLLNNMQNLSDRAAYFMTVIAYVDITGVVHTFEGRLYGNIGEKAIGNNGFGYDPVFLLPDGRSLAEYDINEKNIISHRAKALKSFLLYINNNNIHQKVVNQHKMLVTDAT